jgi:predicted porin
MNKKLVAAAIAAAMAAPAAYAEVTIYGKVHMSVDFVDANNAVGANDMDGIADRDSRIGFKGSEDLGNGLKAVWKTEWNVQFDGGNQTVNNSRDNYLGLATNFGTFLLAGNINHPYKSAFGKYDFFADTLADWDDTIEMEDNRADNAIVYISPSFSGFKFTGASVAAEGANGQDSLMDAYSLAVNYSGGGLMAAAAYEDISDVPATGQSGKKFRIGAGYKMDAFAVAATYEDVEDVDAVVGVDATRWTIQGSFAMGNNKLKAMYGNEDHDTRGDNDAWAIGVDHSFSKRTTAYALYVDSDIGLRNKSNGASTPAGGSGFSIGMVHSF